MAASLWRGLVVSLACTGMSCAQVGVIKPLTPDTPETAPQPQPKVEPKVEPVRALRVSPHFNKLVLSAIKKMPQGGSYAVSRQAATGLRMSMVYRDGGLVVNAKHAVPSYCSGATYLAFLYAVKEAEGKGYIKLSTGDAKALLARGQADGSGIWGRWNANGPGTARLFHETGLGQNFESYQAALPGDFMKIFWTDQIGRKEFGHSVIYLGMFEKDGERWVKFWSSNQPEGYSEKSVPVSKIKWAIFSRITDIKKISRVDKIESKDAFLAEMLTREFDRAEVRKKVGINKAVGTQESGL